MRRKLAPMLAAAGLCAALAVAAAPARADVIERVVAVVNDDAIFLSDLRRRAVPFLPQVLQAQSETQRLTRLEELYKQLLDKLVDEELVQQAAQRMQVRVTRDDVDRAIRNVQRQSGMAEDQFWDAVRQQGLTEAQYRQDVERQLLRLKVLNKRVRGRVNITESDVRERYEQKLRQANRELRFRASHCFFEIPPDATATRVAAIRDAASDARPGLTQQTLDRCVEQHSGGSLGWLSRDDLPEPLAEALLTMEPGDVSEPVRTESGYHLVLLHERERGGANLAPFDQVKEEMFRQMIDEAMAKQEKLFLDELRREAVIDKRL